MAKKEHPIVEQIPNIKKVMKAHKGEFERYDKSDPAKELGRIIKKKDVRRKDVIRYGLFKDEIGWSHCSGDLIPALFYLYAISPKITVGQIIEMLKIFDPEGYREFIEWKDTIDLGPNIPNLDLILEPYKRDV